MQPVVGGYISSGLCIWMKGKHANLSKRSLYPYPLEEVHYFLEKHIFRRGVILKKCYIKRL